MLFMNLDALNKPFANIITKQHVFGFLSACLILGVGIFLARRASRAVARIGHLDSQQKIILQKVTYYALTTIVIAAALSQMGFDLKVLLGAAGVLTVAVGFAAQTSASNLISGMFLIVDRPFVVGDVIEVAGTKGEVLSIDLLSCKIRTFDNIMVRVPNETVVKSDIKNLSYFPIRRIDIRLGVSYNENIDEVRDLLLAVATHNPLVLEEPPPLFLFEGFGDSALNVQFSVWTLRTNMLSTQNAILQEIKTAFDDAGVEIPYPHQVVMNVTPTKPKKRPEGDADHHIKTRLRRSWIFKDDA